MKALGVWAVLLLSTALFAADDPRAVELNRTIDDVVMHAPFHHAFWGIHIERENGEVIAQRNATRLFIPASNRKLFATAFVSDCLALDERLHTRIETRGEVRGGVLDGDLVIVGDGDPSFAGRFDSDRDAMLAPLLDALRERGIRRIDGKIVADVSLFAGEIIPPGWKIGYLSDYYAAPVDALAFNENVIGVNVASQGCKVRGVTTDPSFVIPRSTTTCGSRESLMYRATERNDVTVRGTVGRDAAAHTVTELVAVRDPALYTAEAFRDFLTRHGIRSKGVSVENEKKGARVALFDFPSPDVATLLSVVLEQSQNLYTEMLHRRAATDVQQGGETLDDALEKERVFATTVIGVSPEEFRFSDASGLASDDLVSPHALVQTLRYLLGGSHRAFFEMSMARPGEDGTLRNRLKPLHDRVVAKTGFISGVAALSGELIARDNSRIYFSVIVNHYDADSSAARALIDSIITKLAELY